MSATKELSSYVETLIRRVPLKQVEQIRDELKNELLAIDEDPTHLPAGKRSISLQERIHHVSLCLPGSESTFHDLLGSKKEGKIGVTNSRKLRLLRELSLYLAKIDRRLSRECGR